MGAIETGQKTWKAAFATLLYPAFVPWARIQGKVEPLNLAVFWVLPAHFLTPQTLSEALWALAPQRQLKEFPLYRRQ